MPLPERLPPAPEKPPWQPADYIEYPLKWPDGPLDAAQARAHGRFETLTLLRDIAIAVRAAREDLERAQRVVSKNASRYADAMSRLENGTKWLDFETVVRLATVVGVTLPPPSPPTTGRPDKTTGPAET